MSKDNEKTCNREDDAYHRGREDMRAEVTAWVLQRWDEGVKNRPLVNIHRRTLDDLWRLVYRRLNGEELPKPTHDQLLADEKAHAQAR